MGRGSERETIVVVGFGFVGQANALALVKMGYPVFQYDIAPPVFRYADAYKNLYTKIPPLKHVLEQDSTDTWYLVCVCDRVTEQGEQDLSLISNALETLKSAKGKVVLRSTILPQHLTHLHFDYYLPEFLHEKHAVEECLNPFYFVLGKREGVASSPRFLSEWALRAKKVFRGTPEHAAYIKYLSNLWNAVRVAFVNEVGDMMGHPKSREEVTGIERIIDFLFERRHYLRYGKSFGGHCLPKDLYAFYAVHASLGKQPAILQAALLSNAAHKNRESAQTHLPEWFSSWSDEYRYLNHLSWRQFVWHKFNSLPLVKKTRKRFRFVVAAFYRALPNRTRADVRRIWNKKARENARYFVNTKTAMSTEVDEFALRESGEYDYRRYVSLDETLALAVRDPEKDAVLDIGCGIGRMTEFFRTHFKKVHGVDISSEMVDSAKKRLAHLSGIELRVGDGVQLDYPDNMFDMVFSYQTLQHCPTEEMLFNNMQEAYRTLKPSGTAKLHLRTGRGPYKWHWAYGVSLTPAEARELAERAGFIFIKHEVEDPKSLWIWLEK